MHPSCDALISALQEELQEYGALLHLFELQRDHLLRRNSEGFIAVNSQMERQIEHVTRCRTLRESMAYQISKEYKNQGGTPGDLIPLFPLSRRPLLRALVEEVDNLLAFTQRRAHQNRLLLAQCVDMARETFASCHPETSAAS